MCRESKDARVGSLEVILFKMRDRTTLGFSRGCLYGARSLSLNLPMRSLWILWDSICLSHIIRRRTRKSGKSGFTVNRLGKSGRMNAPDAHGTDCFTADFRDIFCFTCCEETDIILAQFWCEKGRIVKQKSPCSCLLHCTIDRFSSFDQAPCFNLFLTLSLLTKGARSSDFVKEYVKFDKL